MEKDFTRKVDTFNCRLSMGRGWGVGGLTDGLKYGSNNQLYLKKYDNFLISDLFLPCPQPLNLNI